VRTDGADWLAGWMDGSVVLLQGKMVGITLKRKRKSVYRRRRRKVQDVGTVSRAGVLHCHRWNE